MSREKVETLPEALKWLDTSPKAPHDNILDDPELPRVGKLMRFLKKVEAARLRGQENNRRGKVNVDDV